MCFFFHSCHQKKIPVQSHSIEAQLSTGPTAPKKSLFFDFAEATPKSLGKKNIFCWLDFSGLILTCVEKMKGNLLYFNSSYLVSTNLNNVLDITCSQSPNTFGKKTNWTELITNYKYYVANVCPYESY